MITACVQWQPWLPLPVMLAASGCVEHAGPVLSDAPGIPTPDPVLPVPSADQLAWQAQELTAFLHFGINTFTHQEQGDGTDSPTLFDPSGLDTTQWMTTLRDAGFRQALLTAKHHDGFCLWQTRCTSYSVAASPWLAGAGDVVKQFVDAAHQANVRVGLALSPYDRHEPTYGTAAYNAVFQCQLTELLSNYGTVDELWLWNDAANQGFDWNAAVVLARALQPHVLIDIGNADRAGADLRSVDRGAPDQTSVKAPPGSPSAAPIWYPAEAVLSIRPGWFWHEAEDTQLKSLSQLLDVYYTSVGRNSILRLGIPPTTQGVLPTPDGAALSAYDAAIHSIYQSNVAAAQPATADTVFKNSPDRAAAMAVDGKLDTFWAAEEGATSARLEVDLGTDRTFNVVSIQEPIALGERTTVHHLEAKTNGVWTTIASGTAIGARKLHRVGEVTASSIALVITQARGLPAIAELGVYESPFP
ncbi:MAG: alpha-L-fucosidase [Pseudomonadota bacterium]